MGFYITDTLYAYSFHDECPSTFRYNIADIGPCTHFKVTQ